MKKVIVHGGKAHRDEFMSVGLACHAGLINETTPIERRDPTDEEILDPDVLVLDVGGILDPGKGNYDHHQLPRGTEECALSLLAKAHKVPGENDGTYHDLLKDRPWYQATVVLDAMGPFELARREGLKKLPEGSWSPVEKVCLEWFEQDPAGALPLAIRVMKSRIDQAIRARDAILELSRVASVMQVGDLQVLRVDGADPEFFEGLIKHLNADPAVTVSNDDRGPGLALFRRNDHPGVDFSRLEGLECVEFAHRGGFIAKTRSLEDDWQDLVARATV